MTTDEHSFDLDETYDVFNAIYADLEDNLQSLELTKEQKFQLALSLAHHALLSDLVTQVNIISASLQVLAAKVSTANQ